MYKFGSIQKKILIVPLGGVALGMSNNPRQYYRTFRVIRRDWKRADRYNLDRSIQCLSRQRFLKRIKNRV